VPTSVPAVVDLDSARARRAGPEADGWTCAECELHAGPFRPAEARHLARLHDLIQHRGCPTAEVTAAPALIAS
jgi:hypothetical protein